MKHKIGDRIRIKTWKRMVREYGLTKSGDLNIDPYVFLAQMEKEMPRNRMLTIMYVDSLSYMTRGLGTWRIVDAMIDERPWYRRLLWLK